MGERGPLKLPKHLRPVTAGMDPDTLADEARPAAPDRPDSLPAVLAEVWDQIVPELDAAGLLTRCDGPTVELALRHYLAAQAGSDRLLTEGPNVYDDKNERWMKNPASQVFRDHSTAYLEYAKQLGMSFAARARIPAAKDTSDGDQGNPFATTG